MKSALWRAGEHLLRAVLLLFFASTLGVATLSAQLPRQDTTKTREQQIRDRLKNLGPLIRRDSATADTTQGAAPRDTILIQRPGQAPVSNVALTGVQRDSIMQELFKLTGFRTIEYKGGSAVFAADSSRLELRNKAEVIENGQLVKADSSLIYWEPRALACAYGKPEVSGAGITTPIIGDSLCYNTLTHVGFVAGANTMISEAGGQWRVIGDVWVMDEDYYAHDAIFTDCNEEKMHYHFAAAAMKVVKGNVIVARNVTLKFGDVPVFWLPFFVQSLGKGRRSGLLMPRFSINDVVRNTSRYNRRLSDLGFYWAINDYMGGEVALDWFSNNWTALRGSVDYTIRRKFLRGGLTFRHFWEQGGARNFTLSGQNSWEPDERTNVSMNANYTTSSRFVREQTFDPRELNQSINSSGGISRRFGWGSVNIAATRSHFITDNTVNLAPSVGVNFASVTLFPALPGEEKWYSNANWTSSASARLDDKSISIDNPLLSAQSTRDASGQFTSTFTIGGLSWNQNVNVSDRLRLARRYGRGAVPDSIDPDVLAPLPRRAEQRINYSTGLNFQQRLWSFLGNTTLTPGLALRGETLEGDTTGGVRVAAPTRLDFNASMQTALYGFMNGIGPVERIRHRLSPSMTYTYSPKPTVTAQQQQFFGVQNVDELNRISIGINQTFEAKMRERTDTSAAPRDTVPLPRDTARADTMSAGLAGLAGMARRNQGPQPVNLLSLTTDAVVYDFVQARKGRGVQTTQITNSIQSDLLRGLQLSFTHELFRENTPSFIPGGPTVQPARDFSPHLSQVNASFALNSNSGVIRMLGLGRRPSTTQQPTAPDTTAQQQSQNTDLGVLGRSRSTALPPAPSADVGTWNANFNYSLSRPRLLPGQTESLNNQQVTAAISYQPTENWSMNWNTSYSFTRSEFSDHVLTLTRRLHDWDANFDFVKAQNGNFSFQFRVHLRVNPDIKVDYEQRDRAPSIVR